MVMPAKKPDYKQLSEELDSILAQLQAAGLDVDKAVALYERGIAITKQIETYLKQAENKITRLGPPAPQS